MCYIATLCSDRIAIRCIPVAFQVATLLAVFAHPDHLLLVGSRDFAYLPPSSNMKCFGYIPIPL
ncbi:MAG: hypothetical protein QS721_15510 [Candidatus Endonucleobacter sp. (ex Gigantidas childressi)]|nr:hypothetical protein [Candidatus Endonucleobacter sp. (ex Gigantidas childressi)]